ncbi:MAG: HAMP domain-containing protein [Magnetococcales bacterium]|nr:HAMP domain-containing protein [Magnetococcales bacterium]
MKLGVRITLPVVLLAVLFFGVMGWLLIAFRDLEANMSLANDRIARVTNLTFRLNTLDSHIKNILIAHRHKPDKKHLEEISSHFREFRETIQKLAERLDTDQERRLLTLFADAWSGQEAIIQAFITAIEAGDETHITLLYAQWRAKGEMLDALHEDIMGHVSRLAGRTLESLRHSRSLFVIQLAVLVIFAALLIGATLDYQRRKIIKPLQALTQAADETSLGRRERVVCVESDDEIGQLSTSFNRMTDLLLGANAGLQEKVRERTMEMEQAMLETRRYAEELQAANRELENFNFAASHDLQEPLRIILNYTSALPGDLGHDISAEVREDLRFIQESAIRMRRLIQDLTAYAHTRGTQLSWRLVDLDSCLREVMRRLQQPVAEAGARVVWDGLPRIRGDVTLLTHVFQHLVDNAIKFYRPESPPKVNISATETATGWEIRIADQGIGIEPRHRELIFQPFKRLNRRADYAGSGIGLAIVREAVRRHGGEIRVADHPAQGTVFVLFLPHENDGAACDAVVQRG